MISQYPNALRLDLIGECLGCKLFRVGGQGGEWMGFMKHAPGNLLAAPIFSPNPLKHK